MRSAAGTVNVFMWWFKAHSKSVNCVKYLRGSNNRLLVTASDDTTVSVWSLKPFDATVRMKSVCNLFEIYS